MSKRAFKREEEDGILRIAAGILHLANLEFAEDGDEAKVENTAVLQTAAEVINCDMKTLSQIMLFKVRKSGKDVIHSPLNRHQAYLERDSVAKVLYSRLL